MNGWTEDGVLLLNTLPSSFKRKDVKNKQTLFPILFSNKRVYNSKIRNLVDKMVLKLQSLCFQLN